MTSRRGTASEVNLVLSFFEEIKPGCSHEILADQEVWIQETNDGVAVSIASMDLDDLPDEVTSMVELMGLRIGTLEEGDFHLDLQGAVALAKQSRKLSVRVNDQAVRNWLYGKDILGGSVLSWPGAVSKGDACIVVNERWEAIGLGEVMSRTRSNRPVISPIVDLGTYLRDQKGEE